MDTASKISGIISRRNEAVKPLQIEEERCLAALNALENLGGEIASFIRTRDEDDQTVATCAKFMENMPRMRERISNLQEKINHCRRRFGRSTINIGFGGKRGQGKSYLLQKFSGLTDNEVPSGAGKTVTAVRSEIFNSPNAYAEITFYRPDEFLRDVVAPYCAQLQIALPATLEEFAKLRLPDEKEVDMSQVAYLNKLAALKDHLPEYGQLLTGETITESDFSKLRPYVADHTPFTMPILGLYPGC